MQVIKYKIINQHLNWINTFSASNQIVLEITTYTKINASSASNQISLEINIYTKIDASIANNQIGLEITISTYINPSSVINILPSLHPPSISISPSIYSFLSLYLTPLNTHALLHIYQSLYQSPPLHISLFLPLFTFHLYLYLPLLSLSPANISLSSFCPLSLSLHLPYHSLSL